MRRRTAEIQDRHAEEYPEAKAAGVTHESSRLQWLTPDMNRAFACVARLACQLADAPAAVVGIRHDSRGWVQVYHGLQADHQERAAGWCARASSSEGIQVFSDVSRHPSFRYHSLTAGPPHIRFCVSVPIVDGAERLGTLCVLDTDKRSNLAPSVLAALQDLAQLAADEVNLRRNGELLQEVSMMARIGGAELDKETGELSWSGDLFGLLGLSPEHRPSWQQLLLRFPDEARAQLEESVAMSLEQGVCYDLELPMLTHDNERRWVRAKGNPRWRNGEIVGVTGFLQDVTDRKQAEQAKREFVSVVSHELRTPLTSIHGTLGLLAGGVGGKLPEEAQILVDIALRNSDRLATLIDDILDIDKIEAGKLVIHPELVRAADAVEDVVDANQSYANRFGVTLRSVIHADEASFLVDSDKLEQVLTNLISNAVKFSPPGAEVEVVLARPDELTVRIEVVDHGDGVPEEFQRHLFEKFAQADSSDTRQVAGTGLGLAIAKALTEQMGGRIDFVTSAGQGTTMFVEFPAVNCADVSVAAPR